MTMITSTVPEADLKYAALQVAVGQFGDSLSQLSDDERKQVEQIAKAQVALQAKVLATPEAASVVVTGQDVDREIDTIAKRFDSEEDFLAALGSFDLTPKSLERAVAVNLRVDATMELVAASAEQCSETDAKLYYYMNPNKFFQPETRQASHILITINPEYPENTREQAFARISQVATRLQKKSKRFSEQAIKYSECPTAMNGGTLGQVKRGVLFPELDEVLFNMKLGEVSQVIESPVGFHVLMCESIEAEGQIPLHKALPTIIEKLSERNRKAYQKAWLKTLC